MSGASQQGLIGKLVETIAPNTEADTSALTVQILTILGSGFGSGPHFVIGATPHHSNLYSVSIGESSRARKGTGTDLIVSLMDKAEPRWSEEHIKSGFSTGEGVIAQACGGDWASGATKSLLFLEPEFSAVLQVMRRRGNTLSTTLRQAWDGRTLQITTRNSPLKVTGSHISLLAHVTLHALGHYTDLVEVYGGLFNRMLFTCSRRSRFLPDGGVIADSQLDQLAKLIRAALRYARKPGVVNLSLKARKLWQRVYPELTTPPNGVSPLVDAATARGEAQVRRLSMIYALADKSRTVKCQHLRAALEVWRFCRDSAQYAFGGSMRPSVQSRILERLPSSGIGLSLTQISETLCHHESSQDIRAALDNLRESKLATFTKVRTAGRSSERWVRTKREKD